MPNIDKIFTTDKQCIINNLFKMFELFKMFNMFVESKREQRYPKLTEGERSRLDVLQKKRG